MPAPGGEGGVRAMRQALADAGLQPEDIDYINAHGTSTDANEKYETMAIKETFGEHAYKVAIRLNEINDRSLIRSSRCC